MKVHQLLDQYGITQNPFAQEDAQSDAVFREYCMNDVHHPSWDKIFGRVDDLSTSIVFGEKGSGKTALKLQMIEAIAKSNREKPNARTWVVVYDDFNPFLDEYRERLSGRRRRPEKALKFWQLSDHMDAILSLATTKMIDVTLQDPPLNDSAFRIDGEHLSHLSEVDRRDFMLLAAIYDRSHDQSRNDRWMKLKKKLSYKNWTQFNYLLIGAVGTLVMLIIAANIGGGAAAKHWMWIIGLIFAAWVPFLWKQTYWWWMGRQITNQVRVVDNSSSLLRTLLTKFKATDLANQPIPSKNRSDIRYELLTKLQNLLKKLGFSEMAVMVDRVDEPHLIDGSVERMKDLMWSMFDNKFLKHMQVSFKLLLPAELYPMLQKQDKQFYERSRLDKQNLIASLSWSGEAMYDIVNRRLRACAKLADKPPVLEDLFESDVTREELIQILPTMRVPRLLFKFFYRLLVDHCSKYTEDQPQLKIKRETLHSTLAVFKRDLQDFDRGFGII
jgi:hypothetical protein